MESDKNAYAMGNTNIPVIQHLAFSGAKPANNYLIFA